MYEDMQGLDVYIKDFGSTKTFEYIDPSIKFSRSKYLISLTSYLRSKGYKDGENLFGAPYDFRLGPDDNNEDILNKFKNLIE